MADAKDVDLRKQAKQHLESLRAAGVDWLPAAKGIQTPAPKPQAAVATVVAAPTVEVAPAIVVNTTPLSEAAPLSLEQRRTELAVLAQTVSTCTLCAPLAGSRTQTVFGVGPPGVELCFVGEAPGADEDAQGEPFVGAAGQLLNKIIIACGLKREEVYICNTLKCRPPGNRTPLPDEMANCRPFLERQLELVQPKFICCLGGSAAQSLLQLNKSMGQLRKKFHDYRGIPVICTYHPAYLLPHRNPGAKKDVWEDMKMLLARMGRPVPS